MVLGTAVPSRFVSNSIESVIDKRRRRLVSQDSEPPLLPATARQMLPCDESRSGSRGSLYGDAPALPNERGQKISAIRFSPSGSASHDRRCRGSVLASVLHTPVPNPPCAGESF